MKIKLSSAPTRAERKLDIETEAVMAEIEATMLDLAESRITVKECNLRTRELKAKQKSLEARWKQFKGGAMMAYTPIHPDHVRCSSGHRRMFFRNRSDSRIWRCPECETDSILNHLRSGQDSHVEEVPREFFDLFKPGRLN